MSSAAEAFQQDIVLKVGERQRGSVFNKTANNRSRPLQRGP